MRIDGTTEQFVDKVIYHLLKKRESGRFPRDMEFLEALEERQIYSLSSKYRMYLFERFENWGTLETKDIYNHFDKGTYSIEHIMPQQLSSEWKESLGDSYEEIHTRWLHKLANLTLTAYNPKYSNASFAIKRDIENGFKDSGLRLNQHIARLDTWGEVELMARSEALKSRQ